jgi:hypothetical protein
MKRVYTVACESTESSNRFGSPCTKILLKSSDGNLVLRLVEGIHCDLTEFREIVQEKIEGSEFSYSRWRPKNLTVTIEGADPAPERKEVLGYVIRRTFALPVRFWNDDKLWVIEQAEATKFATFAEAKQKLHEIGDSAGLDFTQVVKIIRRGR